MLLSLHNLWCMKQYTEELDNVLNKKKDVKKFRELIVQHTGDWADKTFHAINFVEDCIKIGFEKAYDIYFREHEYHKIRRKAKSLI